MTGLEFKLRLAEYGREIIEERIFSLQAELAYLDEGLAEDTKSSAGDKYETSREMANLERQKLLERLALNRKSLTFLTSLSLHKFDKVQVGSLVRTDSDYLFISISLGVIEFEGNKILFISPGAPLAQALIGCRQDDLIDFNQRKYQIREIS